MGELKGVNDSSKKIADIISVIDGIAFEANILAPAGGVHLHAVVGFNTHYSSGPDLQDARRAHAPPHP